MATLRQQESVNLSNDWLETKTTRYQIPYAVGNPVLQNASALSANLQRFICIRRNKPVILTEIALFLVSGGKKGDGKFRFCYCSLNAGFQPDKMLFQSVELTIIGDNTEYKASGLQVELVAGYSAFGIMTNSSTPLVFRGVAATSQHSVIGFAAPSKTTPVNRLEKATPYTPAGFVFPYNASGMNFADGAGFSPEAYFIKTKLM